MEPIIVGVAAAGVSVAVIYRLQRAQSRPTKTARRTRRTSGSTGRLSKRSWLVQAYNSSGARQVSSEDLSGATAELAGRAAGAWGRRSKARWSRRWTVISTAAARSHDRRQKRWSEGDGPMVAATGRRRPKAAKPADPDPAPAPVPAPAAGKTAAPAAPESRPPAPKPSDRHLKAVPDLQGDTVTTDDTTTTAAAAAPEVPPDWALMINRVHAFVPEDDAALIRFMHGEAAAVVNYAEALEQARDNCVNDVGLDPSAVAGFTAYSEQMSEAAERMAEAYRTFVAVYGEVQQLAASGVVMPYSGRFFTGAAG